LGFGGCKQTVHDSKIINAEEKEKKEFPREKI
jgi:hypothetical protein